MTLGVRGTLRRTKDHLLLLLEAQVFLSAENYLSVKSRIKVLDCCVDVSETMRIDKPLPAIVNQSRESPFLHQEELLPSFKVFHQFGYFITIRAQPVLHRQVVLRQTIEKTEHRTH